MHLYINNESSFEIKPFIIRYNAPSCYIGANMEDSYTGSCEHDAFLLKASPKCLQSMSIYTVERKAGQAIFTN